MPLIGNSITTSLIFLSFACPISEWNSYIYIIAMHYIILIVTSPWHKQLLLANPIKTITSYNYSIYQLLRTFLRHLQVPAAILVVAISAFNLNKRMKYQALFYKTNGIRGIAIILTESMPSQPRIAWPQLLLQRTLMAASEHFLWLVNY